MPWSTADVEAAGGYRVVYADPGLTYRNQARGGTDRHYRTAMTLAEAKALPVARLAARDSVLFMWTTWPYLVEGHQAHDLAEAWGFRPVTVAFVWVKLTANGLEHVGNGWWTRSNTEVCLLGVRGKARRAANSGPPASVRQLYRERLLSGELEPEAWEATVGRHSEKPALFRDRIVQLMGNVPRLEMFARERAEGWDVHGDEVPGGADVVL